MALGVQFKDTDEGLKAIMKEIQTLQSHSVEVGIMGNDSVEGVSVVDYAVFNEFGTSRIPARPFMSRTYDQKLGEINKYMEFLGNTVIEGKANAMGVMTDLGNWYEAEIKKTIVDAKNWAVPNAASTVAMKKSSSPLIDTGRMLGAVKHEIRGA